MKRLCLLLMALLLLIGLLPSRSAFAADEVKKHVLLIDGSGSMEDPAGQAFLYSSGKLQAALQQLVGVDAAFAPNDQITVGIFSKADGQIKSPQWVFRGTVQQLRTGWPKLEPIKGWTDLVGALDAGVDEIKAHKGPQFIWLLTDNIDQAADSTESTEQFYGSLAERTDLHRIFVFPVDLQDKNGLVLYAMSRQRSAATRQADGELLDKAVAGINSSALKPKLGDGGFLVRPLADEGLKVEVVGFTADPKVSPNVTYTFDPAKGTISLQGFAEGVPIKGQFKVRISSKFPALKIVSATVAAEINGMSSGHFVLPGSVVQAITPTKVSLNPGQSADYTIDLALDPPFMLWNPFTAPMGALQDEGTIQGQLRLVVTDTTFAAVQPDKFFKVQRIPEILGNRSHVSIPLMAPVTMHVALPWWRLIEVLLILAVLLGAIFALYKLTMGRKRYVLVRGAHGDVTEPVSYRRKMVIPGVGEIKATLTGQLLFLPAPGSGGGKPQKLQRRRGQLNLADGRSYDYELLDRQRKAAKGKGIRNASGLY
jgi:hypothetical protein